MNRVDFERTKSGIYLPRQPPAPKMAPKKWFGQAVNALLVLIQLVTVWVLWLTYTNTVIPSRQKELLAEQLAQLEMDKHQIQREIEASKGRLAALTDQANKQIAEIASLSSDKRRFQSEVQLLNAKAEAANQVAAKASAKLGATNKTLSLTQTNIFLEMASVVLYYPVLNDGISEANASIDKQGRRDYAQIVDAAEKAWPDLPSMSNSVEGELRKMRSPLFPDTWGPQLADVFSHKMRGFTCSKPDFSDMKRTYKDEFTQGQVKAEADALKAEQDYIDEGLKKGIRYVFTPERKQQDIASYQISAQIAVEYKASSNLLELRSKCFDEFTRAGSSVIKSFLPN